jgi:hypothetical protein
VSIVSDILDSAVGRAEIRTAFGPTISLDRPFAPTPPGDDSAFTKLMQPVITLYPTAAAGMVDPNPITYAPYGDPGETKWPFLVAGFGLLIGWLTFRAFGRR